MKKNKGNELLKDSDDDELFASLHVSFQNVHFVNVNAHIEKNRYTEQSN